MMRPHIRPSHLSVRHVYSPVARPGVLRDIRLVGLEERQQDAFEIDPVFSN